MYMCFKTARFLFVGLPKGVWVQISENMHMYVGAYGLQYYEFAVLRKIQPYCAMITPFILYCFPYVFNIAYKKEKVCRQSIKSS